MNYEQYVATVPAGSLPMSEKQFNLLVRWGKDATVLTGLTRVTGNAMIQNEPPSAGQAAVLHGTEDRPSNVKPDVAKFAGENRWRANSVINIVIALRTLNRTSASQADRVQAQKDLELACRGFFLKPTLNQ